MRFLRVPGNRIVVAVSLALVLGACSDNAQSAQQSTDTSTTTSPNGSTTTAAPDSQTPAAGGAAAPVVGDCLEPMTGPLADGNQLPAIVACAAPHGGEVIAVTQLPGGSDAAYPATQSSIRGADDAVTSCVGSNGESGQLGALGAFGEFVGDNRLELPSSAQTSGVTAAWAVTGLQAGLYVPGPARWAAGERWMVCAAVLNNSSESPTSYDGSAKDVRARRGELAIAFAWCKNQPDPQNAQNFQSVRCDRPHNFEQLSTFDTGASDTPFPGEPALDQLAGLLCAPLSSAATAGKSDQLDASLGLSWTFPQEADWSRGQRAIRCFAATRQGLTTGAITSGKPVTPS